MTTISKIKNGNVLVTRGGLSGEYKIAKRMNGTTGLALACGHPAPNEMHGAILETLADGVTREITAAAVEGMTREQHAEFDADRAAINRAMAE